MGRLATGALLLSLLLLAPASASANTAPNCPSVLGSGLSVGKNTSLQLHGACFDPDGDVLTYFIDTQPEHGAVTPEQGDGNATYTPEPDFTGLDSFTYHAEDTAGSSSNVATVNITVSDNGAPVCSPPPFTTPVDTPLHFFGLNCSDPDPGDSVAGFGLVSGPAHGTLIAPGTVPGAVATYTPAPGYEGPDQFTFTATDTHGAVSAPTTIHITVGNVAPNNKPACPSNTFAVPFQGSLELQGNCTDADGDALSYFAPTTTAQGGTLAITSGSSATYRAPAGFAGDDSFAYHATDARGLVSDDATITLKVAPDGATAANLEPGDTSPTSAEATASEPVLIALTSPSGGPVIIQSTPLPGLSPPPPDGFAFLNQQVVIETAAAPDPDQPLRIAFTLDRSLLGATDDQNTVVVYRDGTALPDCGSTPSLPCVSLRELVDPNAPATSDIRLTVLTDHASTWNFGVPAKSGKGCGDKNHTHARRQACK